MRKKLYYLWYFPEDKNKDITALLKEALNYYKEKKQKILSVEVSKNDFEKSTTIEGVTVIPKKHVMSRCGLLEFEKSEIEEV